jgi:hypothetical protein
MARSTTFLRYYECAVALNNMGVSLLEKGAPRQAIATLNDAIIVMKGISCSGEGTANEVDTMLAKAAHRLSVPEQLYSACTVRVISQCDGNLELIQSLLLSSSATDCPLYIDTFLFDPEDGRVDFESAMILYNFGVAHECLSKIAKNAGAGPTLRENALQLFHLAHTVLANQIFSSNELSLHGRLSFVSALVLRSFGSILADQGRNFEAAQTHEHLKQLVAIMIQKNLIPSDSSNQDFHAAAA